MIAEDGCLTLQKEVFVNDSSNIRYSNLNLSHNTCSMSKDHIVNFVRKDITKVPNYVIAKLKDSTDVDFSPITKDSTFLNKSYKTFNCININSDNFNNKKEKKNFATIKSSTLSLHISAYENSTEAAALNLFSENPNLRKQLNLVQKWETLIQNPLEFPRQQKNEIMETEIAQFKASQKLLNPNESVTLNKNENVSPKGSSFSYGAPLSDPTFQYGTNQHIFPTTDYGAPIGFDVAYQYSLANGYGAPVNTGLQAMSEREKCDKKSDEVPPAPDDWENAGDDAIIASVAERQKQLEQNETNLAAEQEQLKIHQKASGNKTEKNRPEVGEGPIRLLRRQHIGNQQQKTEAELEAEAQERATKALEEREALYQQTRERIFGGEQPPSHQPEPVSSESLQAQLQLHLQQQQQMQQQQSSGPRDHLSDVQMKRADTRKPGQRQQIPQQPPPLNSLPMMMPPPTSVPPPQVPWFFNGAPPPQPLYNIPPPQSMYGAPIPPSSQPPIYGGPGFPVGMPPPPPANFYQYQQYYQQQLQGNPRNRYRY